jgi:hypothetical protein
MFADLKIASALVGLACLVAGPMTGGASAVTVEVAKKCDFLTAKAFPSREPTNPAAGIAKGTVKAAREYFSKCVANGGNMDDHDDKK